MNFRAASKADSTSAASSAGGSDSSSSGLCDMQTRASVMVISWDEVSGGGKGGGGHEAIRPDDDEADGVGVEPLLQPAGGVADHGDVGGFAWVAGRCRVPV